MSFLTYMRKNVWELAFVTLSAACVGVCFSEGCYIPAGLEGRFFPALLICLALNIAAFSLAYTKKTAIAGFAALALAVICAVPALRRGEGEAALYAVVICAAGLSMFFLSRTRTGALLALPLGALVITGEMLFQYGSHPALLIVFLLSSGCLALCRIYRAGMLRSSSRTAAFSAHALLSVAVCVLAALLAAGAYFGIVRPLSPPYYDILLVTELQRLPLLEKLGVSSRIYLPDPDRRTGDASDDEQLSDMSGEDDESRADSETPEAPDSTDAAPVFPSFLTPAEAISYLKRSYIWLYAAAAVLLAVLATIAGFLAARRRRLGRIIKMPAREQVTAIYPALLSAMEKCGLPPIGSSSPMEYCGSFSERIGRFLGESVDFTELTGVFERAFYGGMTPRENERAEYVELYKRLPTICRRSVGPYRYVAVFFKV